jgi:hypothetical protein
LTNNLLLLQQQEQAATTGNPTAVYVSGSAEAVSAQQQTVDEHAQAAADCADSLQAPAAAAGEAGAGSEAAQQSLPMAPSDNEQDACCVFFARVPPTVPYESILALFQQFGTVKSLNLFRPWASAKTSKVSTVLASSGACWHLVATVCAGCMKSSCGASSPAAITHHVMQHRMKPRHSS